MPIKRPVAHMRPHYPHMRKVCGISCWTLKHLNWFIHIPFLPFFIRQGVRNFEYLSNKRTKMQRIFWWIVKRRIFLINFPAIKVCLWSGYFKWFNWIRLDYSAFGSRPQHIQLASIVQCWITKMGCGKRERSILL